MVGEIREFRIEQTFLFEFNEMDSRWSFDRAALVARVGFVILLLSHFTVSAAGHEGVAIPVDEDITGAPPAEIGLDFVQAFLKSIAMIVVTELGDKTFFIAAVRCESHRLTQLY